MMLSLVLLLEKEGCLEITQTRLSTWCWMTMKKQHSRHQTMGTQQGEWKWSLNWELIRIRINSIRHISWRRTIFQWWELIKEYHKAISKTMLLRCTKELEDASLTEERTDTIGMQIMLILTMNSVVVEPVRKTIQRKQQYLTKKSKHTPSTLTQNLNKQLLS
jgi:hypothetical protein